MTQSYTLSLAHINDTHSNFEPCRVQFSLNIGQHKLDVTSHSGGYARIGHHITKRVTPLHKPIRLLFSCMVVTASVARYISAILKVRPTPTYSIC